MPEGAYNVRVVETRRSREIWMYGKRHVPDTTPKVRRPSRPLDELEPHELLEREIRRRKYYKDRQHIIRRLVDRNYVDGLSKFVTLTYAEAPDWGRKFRSLPEAYRWIQGEWDLDTGRFVGGHLAEFQAYLDRCTADFEDFIAVLRELKGEPIQYLCVWEIQAERLEKHGDLVLHWHFMGFNMPYVAKDVLRRLCWKDRGFVDIQLIQDKTAAGRYVAKYFGKGFVEGGRFGRRAYRRSRGVCNPDEWVDDLDAEQVQCAIESLGECYGNEYQTPMGEAIRYFSVPLDDGLDSGKERLRSSR